MQWKTSVTFIRLISQRKVPSSSPARCTKGLLNYPRLICRFFLHLQKAGKAMRTLPFGHFTSEKEQNFITMNVLAEKEEKLPRKISSGVLIICVLQALTTNGTPPPLKTG